jgi:very-short-patch-repair endonuclease
MKLIYNNELNNCARELRKNMTDAELHLWSRLRLRQLYGHQFHRQRIINNYIVDFYCPRAKLVIEVDGGQHFSPEMSIEDSARDNFLMSKGLKVLRFTDTDVLINTDTVLERIVENITSNTGENPP